MTRNTDSMNAAGTASWNRSLIEFTNTIRGFFPSERFFQYGLVNSEVEPVPVFFNAHRLEPCRHSLGVAMLAAVADLRAARYRVPGGLGPFDARLR